MKISEIGEFGLIQMIAKNIRPNSLVTLGIGDDCAITKSASGTVTLTTTDMLVENVHFDLKWSDPETLGQKSLAVNISDIASMGGIPKYALLSLAIPETLSVEFIQNFINGFQKQAAQFDVILIGGDTCSSKNGLIINIALIGEQKPEYIVKRKGAIPGDLICVTGTVGDSAAGLELLKKGEREGELIKRHLLPEPRVNIGRQAAEAGIVTAMIDISDGTAADLGHIMEASNVGAEIDLPSLPISDSLKSLDGKLQKNIFDYALSGGEDYELLMTINPRHIKRIMDIADNLAIPVTIIGKIKEGKELKLLKEDGSQYRLTSKGYDHF
ncbi:MAG: thiamine-phosphate kinase [Desulfuromonadales bacterium]|nr:thiamine-phosphate kinase [Desulfuromonadales bacterium]